MERDRRGWHHHGAVGFATAVVALLAGIAPALTAQDSVTVHVVVEGIDGILERNTMAMLELARMAERGRMPRSRAERLHEKADENIRTALEPFGYYRPSIEKALERKDDQLTARYTVTPGQPVRIREVTLEMSGPGAELPAFKDAAAKFPLAVGDSLSHVAWELGKIALLRVASDSGYLDADFEANYIRVDGDSSTAEVVLKFRTGERFKFGPVRFDQKILDESVLRTRIPFRQGDLWRQDKVVRMQSELAADPYWIRVEIVPLRDSVVGREIPLQVVLEPRNRATYEFGAGYGTDTGPRGRVGGQFRWINRRGHHASARLEVATREQSLVTEYNIPGVFHRTGTWSLVGGFAHRVPTTSRSSTATIGTRLHRERIGWRENLTLAYQRESFVVGVDSATTTLLIAGGSWERSRANDHIYPSRGLRLRFDAQGSREGLLATASFLRVTAGAKAIYGLGRQMRLIGRFDVGRIFTDQFRSLPTTQRFFAGGDQSVRAFDYQELGPADSLGNVIGGPALMVASAEIDFRVLPRWAVAVFTDAGNAMTTLGFRDVEQSVGAGIRFIAPIGMIRVDAAFGVSRADRPFRLHLSIGPDL